jgi:hypothetical protein
MTASGWVASIASMADIPFIFKSFAEMCGMGCLLDTIYSAFNHTVNSIVKGVV